MQQIINFLFKNSINLLFLLLLGISLTFTIQSHSYHRSLSVSSANAVTGYVYEKINDVEQYFSLRGQNEKLNHENAELKRLLYNTQDTANKPPMQLPENMPGNYKVIEAKVISNSYSTQENYLTINAGAEDGVHEDMGVVSNLGVIGYIEKKSKHYATVITILNRKFKMGAKIKKNDHFGTLTWNGQNTGFAQLIDVPRIAAFSKGDTIVTGNESTIFPENIPVGTIDKVYRDKVTQNFTLDVRLFNDMTSLGYIYIIENKHKDEIKVLQEATKPTEDKR
ncbi:rod shape-determining protein MreC [Flavobacterium psychrotrophum]|uniref:rod shape-determining protein MreC n=1 Tax=Flavobacterium psychrotrophum TaxID=2294119 RepID=UPI000E3236DE|nr:rod shape-determining protein MreC [Flavobacterium psychrotrophum]